MLLQSLPKAIRSPRKTTTGVIILLFSLSVLPSSFEDPPETLMNDMDAGPEEGQPRGPGASAMPSPEHLHVVGALSCPSRSPPSSQARSRGQNLQEKRADQLGERAGSETVIQSDI